MLYNADCIEVLKTLKPNSIDLIFADPPYFLSNGGKSVHSGKIVSVNKGDWDEKSKYDNHLQFTKEWIQQELLKEYNGKAIDFYTGKELTTDDISIDHVIPWSFMYSDDIWNLVITSKSKNSQKNNSIPSEKIIKKLKERNNKIKDIVSDSFKMDIEEAMKNNYLDKFYYECRL